MTQVSPVPTDLPGLAPLLVRSGRLDPYPHYSVLRRMPPQHSPASRLAVVSRWTDCSRVLRSPEFDVANAPDDSLDSVATALTAESMLFTEAPRHESMRRLVSWAFTPRRVRTMEDSVRRWTSTLLDRLAELGSDGSAVDLAREFAYRLPVNVVGDLLGIPEVDRPLFGPWATAIDAVLEIRRSAPQLRRADQAAEELGRYLAELVAQRRNDPRDDLISALLTAADAGQADPADSDPADSNRPRLTHEEIIANTALVLINGFATTNDLITNGLQLAFDRPALLRRLHDDPSAVGGFVEEVLRYDPPVQLTLRTARRTTEVGGTTVPAGTAVVVLLASANRDPDRFDEPDRFDVDRTQGGSLSFGAGRHFCFGAPLARLEAACALPALIRRFPGLTPTGPGRRRDRLTLRGFDHLPATLR